MNLTATRELTIPLPGFAPALLTLPTPLSPQALAGVEQALADALGTLRHDLDHGGAEAGEREYASWAGALEYASWMRRLQPARA